MKAGAERGRSDEGMSKVGVPKSLGSPLKGFRQEGKQIRGFGKEEGPERAEPEDWGRLGSLCGTQMRDEVACVGWRPGHGFREIWVENQMNSGI